MAPLSRRKFIWTGLIFVPSVAIAEPVFRAVRRPYRVPAAGGGSAPTLSSASAVDVDANSDDPETWTHTIAALSNGYVVAKIATLSTNIPTSVLWDASAMTKIAERARATDGITVQIWGVAVGSKGAGTYTISADRAGSGQLIVAVSEAWNGVNQSTSTGTAQSADNNSGTATVDVTSASSEIVLDCMLTANNQTLTVGGGQTATMNDSHGAGGSYETGAATTTMSWTFTATGWAICAIPIKGV